VAGEWFPGADGTPEAEVFLSELRGLAGAWGLADVRAGDTGTASDRWGWLVAWVRVPVLPAGSADPQLQVGFGLTALVPPLVATWETDGLLLNSWEDLDLTGLDASPTGRGRRAFTWFDEQLRRPVERLSWRTRRGATTSLWRLADSGELIWWEWSARRRFDHRRPPDDVVLLR
jgi:hypothetical protein